MKTSIKGIVALATFLLSQQITQAQGTITYLSNLGQSSTGSQVVGSDSRIAALFLTGNNAGGYSLNTVQLGMTDASGNPNGFTVMLYSSIIGGSITPGSNLGTLSGSLSPVASGAYTYSPTGNLILSSSTFYYIVLTSGTTIVNGTYGWSLAGAYSYNPSDGWGVASSEGAIGVYQISQNGSSWNANQGNLQFAITATAVPEPSSGILFGFGGLFLLAISFHRRSLKIS